MTSRGAVRMVLLLPESSTTVTIATEDAGTPGLLGWSLLTGIAAASRRSGPRSLTHISNAILAEFRTLTTALDFGEIVVRTAVNPSPVAPVRWDQREFSHVYLLTFAATTGTRALDRNVRMEYRKPTRYDPGHIWGVGATSPEELHAAVQDDVRRINARRARAHSLRWEMAKAAPACPVIADPPLLVTFPGGMVPGDVEAFACRPDAPLAVAV